MFNPPVAARLPTNNAARRNPFRRGCFFLFIRGGDTSMTPRDCKPILHRTLQVADAHNLSKKLTVSPLFRKYKIFTPGPLHRHGMYRGRMKNTPGSGFAVIDMQPTGGRATTFAAWVAKAIGSVGPRRTVEPVVKFIAESPAGEETVNFPLPLTVAFHHNTAGYMNQTDRVVGLVHLLPALAAASHKCLLQIRLPHAQLLHAQQQGIAFLGGNRQGRRV